VVDDLYFTSFLVGPLFYVLFFFFFFFFFFYHFHFFCLTCKQGEVFITLYFMVKYFDQPFGHL